MPPGWLAFERGLVLAGVEAEPGKSRHVAVGTSLIGCVGLRLGAPVRLPTKVAAPPPLRGSLTARRLDGCGYGRKASDEPPPDYVGGLFLASLLGAAQVITRAPLSA
jgi:hypothetical protein